MRPQVFPLYLFPYYFFKCFVVYYFCIGPYAIATENFYEIGGKLFYCVGILKPSPQNAFKGKKELYRSCYPSPPHSSLHSSSLHSQCSHRPRRLPSSGFTAKAQRTPRESLRPRMPRLNLSVFSLVRFKALVLFLGPRVLPRLVPVASRAMRDFIQPRESCSSRVRRGPPSSDQLGPGHLLQTDAEVFSKACSL